ncbi:hypothetical protein LTS12_002523 [Elasticomyces elasticus]|nr:hypothetical protein LTS12_002523 [Elasticomyces elasticus]
MEMALSSPLLGGSVLGVTPPALLSTVIDRPNDGFHGSCQRTSAQLLTSALSDGEEAINPAVASDDGKIGITRDPANDPCRFAGTLATGKPIFNKHLLQYGIAYNSQSSIEQMSD